MNTTVESDGTLALIAPLVELVPPAQTLARL